MQLTNGIKCFNFIMKLFPLTLNLISTVILLMFIQATVPVTCLLVSKQTHRGYLTVIY